MHANFGFSKSPIPAGPEPGRVLARETGSCEGSTDVENIKFSHFWIPGVKKADIGFPAEYAIWKHLDSSSFKIIAKVAS